MLRIVLAVGLSLVVTTTSLAQDGSDATGIEDVISSQMEAFRADDFDTAFTYASPSIKGIFGTPQRFGQMVRQGYPMVHRPADVTFLDLEDVGAVKRQKVMVRDVSGAFHVLQYDMIELNGIWQIDGVRVLEAAQVGV